MTWREGRESGEIERGGKEREGEGERECVSIVSDIFEFSIEPALERQVGGVSSCGTVPLDHRQTQSSLGKVVVRKQTSVHSSMREGSGGCVSSRIREREV